MGNKSATMPLTVPVLRILEACHGQRTTGPQILRPVTGNSIDRRDAFRMVARIAKAARIPRTSADAHSGTPRSPTPWTRAYNAAANFGCCHPAAPDPITSTGAAGQRTEQVGLRADLRQFR
jgi:hypothetical protein